MAKLFCFGDKKFSKIEPWKIRHLHIGHYQSASQRKKLWALNGRFFLHNAYGLKITRGAVERQYFPSEEGRIDWSKIQQTIFTKVLTKKIVDWDLVGRNQAKSFRKIWVWISTKTNSIFRHFRRPIMEFLLLVQNQKFSVPRPLYR